MITLRDLQYLVALEKHRHFGRAAESCYVSQPTLSGQFKKLEDYLGITLVERNRHQVVMTAAGMELAERAKSLITDAQEFERHAKALLDPLSGDIHLGLVPTIAPYLLARIMAPLTESLPNMQFYLHEQQTLHLLKQLDAGDLDLLIVPWTEEMEMFDRIDLFTEGLQLATPTNHPLKKKTRPKLSDLNGYDVLSLEDGHCLRDDAMSYCFAAGAKEDQRFRATSLETLRYMVASGVGITLMPELAIDQNGDDDIVYRKFAAPQPGRQISAIFRHGYAKKLCVRKIADIVVKTIHPKKDS